MKAEIPGAVPEIPVSNVHRAADYYRNNLGFNLDWGDEAGGGASRASPKGNVECSWLIRRSERCMGTQDRWWFGSIPAAGKKWTTYISSGVAAKPRSSLRRNRSLGSCMSSRRPIWMAICCACSTISPGRPSDVGRRLARTLTGQEPTSQSRARMIIGGEIEPIDLGVCDRP